MTDKNAIHQLLGQSPSWMLRWGILVIALFFLLLALLSWFIQYPDTITAKVTLHTENLPVRLEMPVDGRVDSVFVRPRTTITDKQLVLLLQSPSKYADILRLDDYCQQWTLASNILMPQQMELGTIAPFWSAFVLHKKELDDFYQNDISIFKSDNIRQQIAKLEELHQALLLQQGTFQKNIDLAQKAKDRDENLLNIKAASIIEVEQSTKNWLDAKRDLEQHSTSIINNQVQIERLRADLLDIAYQQKTQQSANTRQLQRDIAAIQNAIYLWKKQYLVFAPIGGMITWQNTWVKGQFLSAKTVLGTILPEKSQHQNIMATAFVPSQGFGKIKENADVQIQLAAYPYQEFGTLKGQITSIPTITEDGFYKIKIKLGPSLETSYHKKIPFRQELKGMARITTQKRRLAERFFDRIWSALQN